eukprot:gene11326-biopygen12405
MPVPRSRHPKPKKNAFSPRHTRASVLFPPWLASFSVPARQCFLFLCGAVRAKGGSWKTGTPRGLRVRVQRPPTTTTTHTHTLPLPLRAAAAAGSAPADAGRAAAADAGRAAAADAGHAPAAHVRCAPGRLRGTVTF